MRPAEHRVAHRPADQRQLVPGVREHASRGRRSPARSAPARRPRGAGARPRSARAARVRTRGSTLGSRGGRSTGLREAQGRGLTFAACSAGSRSVLPWRRWRSRWLLAARPHADPGGTPSDDPRRAGPAAQAAARSRRRGSRRRAGAPTAPGPRRRPARGHHRQADPLDDPRQGHGPGLRVGHQQRHRDLVDDQHPTVHLRRPAHEPGPARRGRRRPPADAVVGDRINDEQHKDFIEELAPGEHAALQH